MSVMDRNRRASREARQAWARATLFGVALVISLALHGLLLAGLPIFPVERFRGADLNPTRPLVMDEVRPAPDLSRFIQPEAFRPENPEAFAEVESLQKSLLENLRAGADATVFVAPGPAEASPPQPETDWPTMDWRQEILQIEQQTAAVELQALPRRVVPALPRLDGAPDITLPADSEAIAAAAAAAAADGSAAAAVRPLSVLTHAAPPAAAMIAAAQQDDFSEAERIREQGKVLDETPADVTDVEPIEQLLAVEVTTYPATEEDALYFELAISRAGMEGLPVLPKDILLIQDCSESITRTKLDFFKEGIVGYLRTLTTADRVNLMRYSDAPTLCFDDWAPVTADALAEAVQFTDAMRARGQTDLFTPLQRLLKLHQPSGRPMIAVLMTDGRPTMGAVDSSDIIARFSRLNNGRVSVFTVGAGARVNTFLLDLLGHNNRGGSWLMPLREHIPATVQRAARELSRPVLANLTYRFSSDSEAEVYPGTLTHLFLDRPLRLVGRAPLGQKTAVLHVIGDSGAARRDMVFALDLSAAEDGGEGIRREWVAQKIYTLINDHLASGRDDTLRKIRDLSLRHNVPLPYGADFPM
ncbi:MAG: VWA domain-containing protein [Kiritimatiellia bacterium]|jgi:uncharacterized protein YegL|nr:VWA domain-containing protein [Kiritimatiellia bacterium]